MPRHLLPLACFALVFTACTHSDAAADAAVERCTSALRASADESDSAKAGRTVAASCAPLYKERACREGYVHAWDEQTDPAARIRILTTACSDAYCPELPAPKPALCAQPTAEQGGFAALSVRWREFQRTVLVRDLGAARAEKVLAAMSEAAEASARRARGE